MKVKIKTKRAAVKRFKISASGRISFYKSGKRHLLGTKSSKLKRNKRGSNTVDASDQKRTALMFPGLI